MRDEARAVREGDGVRLDLTENLAGVLRAILVDFAEALVSHARKHTASEDHEALQAIKHLMPGLGEPIPLRLDAKSPAVGRSLAELDLRGQTGASVLAIARGEEGLIVPMASEVLRDGDLLALAGTKDAIQSAMSLLQPPDATQTPDGWHL